MRGFTDTANPVYLHVSDVFATALGKGPGPFQIDGRAAERDTDGLVVTVAGTRYFVPLQHVVMVRQVQDRPQLPEPTQIPPPAP